MKLKLQLSGKSTGVSDNFVVILKLVVSVGDPTSPANLTDFSYLHPSRKNG